MVNYCWYVIYASNISASLMKTTAKSDNAIEWSRSNTRVQTTVLLHVCFASEASLTLRTLVWLLTRLASQVNIQVPAVCKLWIAQQTCNFFGMLEFKCRCLWWNAQRGRCGRCWALKCIYTRPMIGKITRGLKLRTYTGRGKILMNIMNQNQKKALRALLIGII